jgi:hypothetical protein
MLTLCTRVDGVLGQTCMLRLAGDVEHLMRACRCCLQSNIDLILSSAQGPSFESLKDLTFQQIRSDSALLAIAQDNGYPSVDAMIPGISAFENEVRAV